MICAGRRVSVYAFVIGCFICAQGIALTVSAKGSKGDKSVEPVDSTSSEPVSDFQWQEHSKLSWADFQGPVNATSDESAAATHCGIGFKVNTTDPGARPVINVYNTFYINKSWVRPDAHLISILEHEQGHFDLCEIYTRKLKKLMDNFNFNVSDTKAALMGIFTSVNNEYEQRQQAYEYETTHGTNIEQQKKWIEMISRELN